MKITRLDHVSFTVGELERSVAFYRRFGLEPIKSYRSEGPDVSQGTATADASLDIVWLGLAATSVMLELIRYRNRPVDRSTPNSRVGAAHLCFCVTDVDAAYAELRAVGVEFFSRPNEDEFRTRWVYFHDPDGNTVEMIQDPPSSS